MVYPIVDRVSTIQGGAGFLPSTVGVLASNDVAVATAWGQVLHKAVKHKADIVAIDEKETGLRATLSLEALDRFRWNLLVL